MKSNLSYTNNFAYYYDQLIDQDFYLALVDRINALGTFNSILDLACGSGRLALMLKNDTNKVSGLDLSEEMLMIAQAQNIEQKKGVNFIIGDLNELDLPDNQYDLVTCSLDSLNYLDDINNINNLFKEIFKSIKQGYFIFDVLTFHYLNNIVADYYQCEEVNDFEYVWQVNKVDESCLKHDLKIADEHQTYQELHLQYIYDDKILLKMLEDAGFTNITLEEEYNELDDTKPSRIYFICEKR